MQLTGLHHVTAVTGDAPANLAFYTDTLGLRLVKKTVNQDDVSAYHLFYGDAAGHPGTEVTFFDWPRIGPNVPGAGGISAIALRVPGPAALEWWARRLTDVGVQCGDIEERGGRLTLDFADPEGQRLQLVDDGGAPGGTPWPRSPVPAEHGLKGLDGVALTVRRLGPTAEVLTEVLGMRRAREYERQGRRVVVFEMGAGGPGAELHVEERPDLSRGHVGAGGVHHVAFRTPDDAEQAAWRGRIRAAGLVTSDLIDRFYFRSLYFREPGGVLFEIATDGPGFAADEDPAHLGERLSLPPFLEPQRRRIEAGLRPLAGPEVTAP
ncbi:MAG: ring-cleaving dioxygenase [Armatimonadetes bacterium]|nr:ring-cleaving dioxygenase [Armatimonadota bacterium]